MPLQMFTDCKWAVMLPSLHELSLSMHIFLSLCIFPHCAKVNTRICHFTVFAIFISTYTSGGWPPESLYRCPLSLIKPLHKLIPPPTLTIYSWCSCSRYRSWAILFLRLAEESDCLLLVRGQMAGSWVVVGGGGDWSWRVVSQPRRPDWPTCVCACLMVCLISVFPRSCRVFHESFPPGGCVFLFVCDCIPSRRAFICHTHAHTRRSILLNAVAQTSSLPNGSTMTWGNAKDKQTCTFPVAL